MNFAKAEIITKDEVPDGRGDAVDYTPLFKKVAAMVHKHDALKVPIEKAHHVKNIQNAIDKEFKKGKFKTFQRTIKGQLYCIVVQAN